MPIIIYPIGHPYPSDSYGQQLAYKNFECSATYGQQATKSCACMCTQYYNIAVKIL